MKRNNTLQQIARLTMFIISLFNVYFPCGVAKTTSIVQQGFDKKIKSRILKPCPRDVKVTKRPWTQPLHKIYEKIDVPLKIYFGWHLTKHKQKFLSKAFKRKKSHAEIKKERRKKRVNKSWIQPKCHQTDLQPTTGTVVVTFLWKSKRCWTKGQ